MTNGKCHEEYLEVVVKEVLYNVFIISVIFSGEIEILLPALIFIWKGLKDYFFW